MMTTTCLSKYTQTKADKLDPNKLIGGKATQLRNIDPNLVPDWVAITADCPDSELSNTVLESWIKLFDTKGKGYIHANYAVRSSALAEDGEEQSYAGVFESKLNVPATGLEHAVREVRDSMYSKRVAAYGNAVTKDPTVEQHEYIGLKTAVIIMPMVEAKFSGVLFTKEPVGGTNQMLVEYEHGVGGVVDGTSDTEMLFIDIENISKHTFNESINTPQQQINWGLPKIVHEARRLENNYRKPLDIEWAIDKDGVPYILQVRPITAGVGV